MHVISWIILWHFGRNFGDNYGSCNFTCLYQFSMAGILYVMDYLVALSKH